MFFLMQMSQPLGMWLACMEIKKNFNLQIKSDRQMQQFSNGVLIL